NAGMRHRFILAVFAAAVSGPGCAAPGTGAAAAAPASSVAAAAASATVWTPGNGRLPQLAPIGRDAPFTFVVMGDNRGSARGRQPKVFLDILAGVRAAHPAFAVTTGDMINGYSANEAVLRLQ